MIFGLVAAGRVKPQVQKTFALADAAQALKLVEDGHSVGKIVLNVS